MAKYELKFLCEYEDYSLKVSTDELQEFNDENEIINRKSVICLEFFELFDKNKKHEIFLDKSTAIKFAKTLRTEINKITESEV
jgi:hypothetical protein